MQIGVRSRLFQRGIHVFEDGPRVFARGDVVTWVVGEKWCALDRCLPRMPVGGIVGYYPSIPNRSLSCLLLPLDL
jgi:hypothetical protein